MQMFARYGQISALVILLGLVVSPRNAFSGEPKFTDIERFQCVTDVGPATTGIDDPYLPGTYRTVINVYNPNASAVTFSAHAVVARSWRSRLRGVASTTVQVALLPGQAVGIDCLDIAAWLGGPQPVGNGDVVIQADQNLKVITGYTNLAPLS